MAKKRYEWQTAWPYLAAGAVVAAVVVMAVVTQNDSGTMDEYGDIMKNADKAAEYRAAQKAAEGDAAVHGQMADFHAGQAASATTIGDTVGEGAKAAGEKVQEGTASVREGFNGAMADYHNGEMVESISATLPITSTVQ